ncbi:hypothetical protein PIB30_047917 [Stylosanthes scabra]|uniref:Uncharacterized protein n=1 Tax=Stylosanthes scabra TaxID=79078 RepID=A0ABU6TIR9_9FABA|nr:hypothetical protein [Stylosanthes scabra]
MVADLQRQRGEVVFELLRATSRVAVSSQQPCSTHQSVVTSLSPISLFPVALLIAELSASSSEHNRSMFVYSFSLVFFLVDTGSGDVFPCEGFLQKRRRQARRWK